MCNFVGHAGMKQCSAVHLGDGRAKKNRIPIFVLFCGHQNAIVSHNFILVGPFKEHHCAPLSVQCSSTMVLGLRVPGTSKI